MENYKNFEKTDLIAANTFGVVAKKEGLKRIIYLGGLAEDKKNLSKHLKSRHDTGRELSNHGIDVTEFRASVIVGSGSLSFEKIRNLKERIPIKICHKWVYKKNKPIAISNILE